MENMTNNAEYMLRARDIYKSFGSMEVLRGISLDVSRGEVLSIIGPSGSGKSTLLRCLNRLETIDRGSIEVKGSFLVKNSKLTGRAEYAPAMEARMMLSCMGMVFQQFNLFPHMTVLENLMEAPIQVKKQSREEIRPVAEELLRKVGLYEKRDAYPSRLSGGQQQRVAIARALATNPEVVFFDEPTSALDPELTGEVLTVIKQLADEGRTMIVVTHEMEFARKVATRVVFMEEGEIVEENTAREFFENPQKERTKEFIHKSTTWASMTEEEQAALEAGPDALPDVIRHDADF